MLTFTVHPSRSMTVSHSTAASLGDRVTGQHVLCQCQLPWESHDIQLGDGMDKIPQVLHRSARAITTTEFYDAIMATCAPRFLGVRGTSDQRVVLAISGGVDSMALAYLCQKVRAKYMGLRISDNKVGSFRGVVVDHGLREGSDQEAMNVVSALQEHLGMKAETVRISWNDGKGNPINPHELPNFETVARQRRYERIASFCVSQGAVSLFTAHNEDDQYETVLMRLLSGHGYRGLQGMRAATDIPECYHMHGAYQSGYVDDQMRTAPLYNTRPTDKEAKRIKQELRRRIDPTMFIRELLSGSRTDPTSLYQREFDGIATGSRQAPLLNPMDIEDGGIMLYRPLLNFSKDRLIATCLENNIPWFEDKTNHDPTFTMRNAVRHMCKTYTLPVALQKPAILDFSRKCRDKVTWQKAETDRLFKRTIIHDFDPNVGTAVVELPEFFFPRSPRRSLTSPARRQKRIQHCRLIAALLIRRLLSLVTPERELTPIKNLDYLISLLFPRLATSETPAPPYPPKPYVICGVHFTPLVGNYSPRWLLSRAPYPSNVPRPTVVEQWHAFEQRHGKNQNKWPWRGWSFWKLYDGRYWVRLRHRLPAMLIVAPFEPEHHKPFREALGDAETKTILSLVLKRYAPGKVRYTLPAVYVLGGKGQIDDLLEGRDYWARYGYLWRKRNKEESSSTEGTGEEEKVDGNGETNNNNNIGSSGAEKQAQEHIAEGEGNKSSLKAAAANTSTTTSSLKPWQQIRLLEREEIDKAKPRLVALPTLGIQIPGVGDWVECEVRYKKVDIDMVTQRRRFWVGGSSSSSGPSSGTSSGGMYYADGILHRSGWFRPCREPFAVWRGYERGRKRTGETYRVNRTQKMTRKLALERRRNGSGSGSGSESSMSKKSWLGLLVKNYF